MKGNLLTITPLSEQDIEIETKQNPKVLSSISISPQVC